MTDTPRVTNPTKLDTIAEAGELAKAIDHSRWGNRVFYLWAFTFLLMAVLAVAIWFDKPITVIQILAGLIGFAAFLLVVTPSGEQVLKMLAQVAAIRAGTKAN